MKILNLYAGLGGNRKDWENVKVTAVEMESKIAEVYKQNFPEDIVVIGDAHQYLLNHYKEFDFIWSSPPCQTHSKMAKATRHELKRYSDMGLYQEILFLKHFFNGKFVVENVKPYYEPLIKPSNEIGRHLFWSNFKITPFDIPNFKGFITAGTVSETEKMKEWCRACNIVSRDRLSRGYIATRLHIPVASLSPEMEEQKRMQLRITRTINQLNKTI